MDSILKISLIFTALMDVALLVIAYIIVSMLSSVLNELKKGTPTKKDTNNAIISNMSLDISSIKRVLSEIRSANFSTVNDVNKRQIFSEQTKTYEEPAILQSNKKGLTFEDAILAYSEDIPEIKDYSAHMKEMNSFRFYVKANSFGPKGPSSVIITRGLNDREGYLTVISYSSFEQTFYKYFNISPVSDKIPKIINKTIKPAKISKGDANQWTIKPSDKGLLEVI